MYLGIVPSHNGRHHDPSACLVEGDEILAFVEEERMSRNKHAKGEFPINAIEECFRIASAEITDVEEIGLPRNYNNRRKILHRLSRRSLRSNSIGIGEKLWDSLLLPAKQTIKFNNKSLRSKVTNKLSNHFQVDESKIPPIQCINHQLTHAASAFYPSGFEDALVVSLDNYGGHLSGAIYYGDDTGLHEISSTLRFNSLGRFYGDFTEFLGFRRSNGEGKVMGLAPYGEINEEIRSTIKSYVNFDDENGIYNTETLTYRKPSDAIKKLETDLGVSKRYWKDDIGQQHKDIAFHVQKVLEDVVTDLISYHIKNLDTTNVCLAGGVALNCKMNKQIRELSEVDNVFVQPAANDAGGSLGAALKLNKEEGNSINEMKNVYFGSEFSSNEITYTLDELKIHYQEVDNPTREAADILSEGGIVGWFQGSMEIGPRALGNRSILADPRSIESRDNVNKFVKHREEWRPFAPSMLIEDAKTYLEGDLSKAAYFMIDTYETTPEAKEEIPAVLHPSDGTTRPQIVTKNRNKKYYNLLNEFKERTGVGVLLNTSFNDSGEPIVRTPLEAIRDFYSMGLDALFLNNVNVHK